MPAVIERFINFIWKTINLGEDSTNLANLCLKRESGEAQPGVQILASTRELCQQFNAAVIGCFTKKPVETGR